MIKKFVKYRSIENSYQDAFVEKVKEVSGGVIFYTEEKIHGANFQFHVDDSGVTPGRRTDFLGEEDKFYSWKRVFEKYEPIVKAIRDALFPESSVIFYGELFGGSYPHPDVKADSSWSRIQKEVSYCPHQDFICFDILIHNEEEHRFLDVSDRNAICTNYGIPFCRPLYKGTLEECLAQSNEFPSTIHKLYDLPEIEGNICEGIVIRPETDLYVRTGERAILKSKNAKFTEKKSRPRRPRKEPAKIPEHIEIGLEKAREHLTQARLDNVLIKMGVPKEEVDIKDFKKYLREMYDDVWAEFYASYAFELSMWSKEDRKQYERLLHTEIALYLKSTLFRPKTAVEKILEQQKRIGSDALMEAIVKTYFTEKKANDLIRRLGGGQVRESTLHLYSNTLFNEIYEDLLASGHLAFHFITDQEKEQVKNTIKENVEKFLRKTIFKQLN